MATGGITIGISTKMYLGYDTSKVWLKAVAALASGSAEVRAGRVKLFVAPSFPVLEASLTLARGTNVQVAAQNASDQDAGALTGEVSPAFLAEMGVALVEIGHAERRRHFGEDNAVVARKVAAAQRNGLRPLLCVGEERRERPDDAARTCLEQIRLANINPQGPPPVIAYEPVWAIGAPQPADPDYVCAVTDHLRQGLELEHTLLYGGSAGPGLLPQLYPHVDGLFLGRFAHDPRNIAVILEEATTLMAKANPEPALGR
ncbi:MAG: triosephosphate isomerase [Pseudarthrobacter sp.]|nr:triosephosphate isomerase [Pseudarthrobacter sp.]